MVWWEARPWFLGCDMVCLFTFQLILIVSNHKGMDAQSELISWVNVISLLAHIWRLLLLTYGSAVVESQLASWTWLHSMIGVFLNAVLLFALKSSPYFLALTLRTVHKLYNILCNKQSVINVFELICLDAHFIYNWFICIVNIACDLVCFVKKMVTEFTVNLT